MAKKVIEISVLSASRINDGKKKIEGVCSEIERQCVEFCDELADIGVKACINATNGNPLNTYVYFGKRLELSDSLGVEYIVFGKQTRELFSADGTTTISPLLMMEYGSGLRYALPAQTLDDGTMVGLGTFPNQTHAENPNGWYYFSLNDNKWHHSYGIAPSAPMQKAYDEMVANIDKVKRKVFRF